MKKSALILALALSVPAWAHSTHEADAPPARGPGGGSGGGGPGGFDPAQFQQMIMDNFRQQLEVENDDEWSALRPLVQKVLDAQQEAQQFATRGGRVVFGSGAGPRRVRPGS